MRAGMVWGLGARDDGWNGWGPGMRAGMCFGTGG